MKKVTLHQVLEQVKMLTPDEQRELREILDFVLAELAITRIRKKQKKKCQYVN